MIAKARDSRGRFVSNGHNGNLDNDERFLDLVHNVLTSRKELFARFLDPRRDIDDEAGYPRSGDLSPQSYQDLYDRESVATRVVEVMPKESWQVQPTVFETEDADNVTAFETAWAELSKQLRGESWYQDEEGSQIWEHLLRADILSGIGSFGIVLIGIDDNQPLGEPVDEVLQKAGSPTATRKLLYVRSFPESLVEATQFETDITNPRFGQPITYNVTFHDPNDDKHGGVGLAPTTEKVHWTRVIHIADNLGSSEIFGAPRMQPVLNRLLDLRKLYGGSAEMYWRGAFPGISIESHPQLGGDVTIDAGAMRDQMEQYMNGLQRYLALVGVSAKSLAPQVVDPNPQIDAACTAICIRLGIPKRIFTGSERGSLASTQDDATWNDRLRHRQVMYITPRIIVPFIDRLIKMRVLPEPEGYSVVWPDMNTLTDQEKADVAAKRTDAMVKYIGGGGEALMVPVDYLTRILGFDTEEVEAIVEAATAAIDEQAERDEAVRREAEGMVDGLMEERTAKEAALAEGNPKEPPGEPIGADRTLQT